MPLEGFFINGTKYPLAEIESAAAHQEKLLGYPAFYLVSLCNDARDHNHPSYAASLLASGMFRQAVLKWLYPYYERVEDMHMRSLGTWIHSGLGHIDGHMKFSTRLAVKVGDVVVSGMPDYYNFHSRTLLDYKYTTSKDIDYIRIEHGRQLQVYRWLLWKNGYDVDQMGIVYITPYKQVIKWYDDTLAVGPMQDFVEECVEILQDGYERHIIPDMIYCDTDKCRYCPVRKRCEDEVQSHSD